MLEGLEQKGFKLEVGEEVGIRSRAAHEVDKTEASW